MRQALRLRLMHQREERRDVEVVTGIGAGGTLGLRAGEGAGVATGDAVVARGVRSVEAGLRVRFANE